MCDLCHDEVLVQRKEIERLRAEIENLRRVCSGEIDIRLATEKWAEQAEANLARVVKAGKALERVVSFRETCRPELEAWYAALAAAQPEEHVSTAAVFGEAADRLDDLAAQPEEG